MKILLLISLIALFALKAIADVYFDKNNKVWGKRTSDIREIVIFVFAQYFDPGIQGFAAYVFLRYALFNFIYNLVYGHPLLYLGTVATTDRILTKMNPPMWLYLTSIGISLTCGLLLIFIK